MLICRIQLLLHLLLLLLHTLQFLKHLLRSAARGIDDVRSQVSPPGECRLIWCRLIFDFRLTGLLIIVFRRRLDYLRRHWLERRVLHSCCDVCGGGPAGAGHKYDLLDGAGTVRLAQDYVIKL